MAVHNETGKKGEVAAANFLRSKGFEVLATNYRFHKAEIDIIASKDNLLVFVEVKTRSTNWFGFPEQSVDKKKQQLISLAATNYIEENKITTEIRFDVISLTKSASGFDIHHIEDAFFSVE